MLTDFNRSFSVLLRLALVLCAGWNLLMHTSAAAAPRVLPPGSVPNDIRLAPLKDLDGYFPFQPIEDRQEWAQRSERVRRQLHVALGLWPMPTPAPLHPVIHGRIERDQFTIEKVYFESYPGFFVTGNLYRPIRNSGKQPGVLCPHGHWSDGRFHDAGEAAVRKEIVQGAERFEESGRSPLQARCVQLARMGCVVFHYDMVGYADCQQISFDIAHRFAKQRPDMNSVDQWGFYSPQAEARLQTIMGLQTYNSIRALDFLLSLPDVDPERIGVTGASGGGTQTFILCAIDPRPTVAFPAVMVSTAMQGGCTCENASLLRVGTGNIELAALFAPKPLGMTAADDWTKEMQTKGFPELKRQYQILGAPDNVFLKPLLHFGHNYNFVSRAALYSWFNKHLRLGLTEPIVEDDFKRFTKDELSVWNDNHTRPPSGPDFERILLRNITQDATRQIQTARLSLESYRHLVGGALQIMIGRSLAEVGPVEWELKQKEERDGYVEMTGLLHATRHHEELPTVFLYPKSPNGHTVLWLNEAGKAGLYDPQGALNQPIQALIKTGATVASVDLLLQGEFHTEPAPLRETRKVKNTREFAGYTFGYNPTLFAQRVHDILTVVSFVQRQHDKPERLSLVALGATTAPLAAAARAIASDAIHDTALFTAGFRFASLIDFHDPNFLPGGAKYDDLPGILALGAPGMLWLAGELAGAGGQSNPQPNTTDHADMNPDVIRNMYKLAGAENALTFSSASGADAPNAAVQWLTSLKP